MEFRAYAPDCLAAASFEPREGRLNDVINQHPSIVVRDAILTSLEDGHAVQRPLLELTTEDLCAVVASGTRGREDRRIRTRQEPVAVEVGPYAVHGFLHAPPTASALGGLGRRPVMVALTEATIAYMRAGDLVTEEVDTLLVNRVLAHRFATWVPLAMRFDAAPVYSMGLAASVA